MSIRATAQIMEDAATDLSRRGRGFLGHRERHVRQMITDFLKKAFAVPSGGDLPHEVRESLQARIDGTIEALEAHVSRSGSRSPVRLMQGSGVVRQIYALREAQEHVLQTPHRVVGRGPDTGVRLER